MCLKKSKLAPQQKDVWLFHSIWKLGSTVSIEDKPGGSLVFANNGAVSLATAVEKILQEIQKNTPGKSSNQRQNNCSNYIKCHISEIANSCVVLLMAAFEKILRFRKYFLKFGFPEIQKKLLENSVSVADNFTFSTMTWLPSVVHSPSTSSSQKILSIFLQSSSTSSRKISPKLQLFSSIS